MEDSSEKKTINVMDADEHAAAQATETKVPEVSPVKPEMSDEVSAVESEKEATTPLVDNDHSLDDAKTQRQLSTTSAALAQEKTKRRSKPLLVFLLALLMTLLGAVAGVFVYKAYFDKSATPQTTTPVVTTTPSKLTAKQVVAAVTPKLVGKSFDNGGSGVPAVKVAGYDFYTSLSSTNSEIARYASTVEQTNVASTRAAVNSILVDKGFTEKTVTSPADSVDTSYYVHSDVTCLFYDAAGSNQTAAHMMSIDCADMSTYESVAKAQQPFGTVYVTAAKSTPELDTTKLLFLDQPTIKDSKTTGYRTAQLNISSYADGMVGVGGFVGLFYQTPDKTWHFFQGTQNELSCSQYNTPDLKKAYLGESCGDQSGAKSTVSL